MKITIHLSSFFGRSKPAKRVNRNKPSIHRMSFVQRACQCVTRHTHERSRSTVSNYRTALRSFEAFLDGREVTLRDIDSTLLQQYALWLEERSVSRNTSSCYLRSLRALYHQLGANDRQLPAKPFVGVFTGNVPTAKRAVTVADLRKLRGLQLPKGSSLALARDIFMFCFYAMGIPFADVVRLKRTQVRGNAIGYCRRKTGRYVHVGIEPCMREILNRYGGHGGTYAFPVLPEGVSDEEQHKAYTLALYRYNRALRRLARMAGIERTLCSYVPRHTWATRAYANRVELAVIAQALGHASTRTTWTYVNMAGNGVLATANRKIIREITKNTSVEEVCKH